MINRDSLLALGSQDSMAAGTDHSAGPRLRDEDEAGLRREEEQGGRTRR
jgi:hypothetical protein